jgi:hypothetical protein
MICIALLLTGVALAYATSVKSHGSELYGRLSYV